MTGDAASIVMVEDDAGHARLIEKNMRRAGVSMPIRHFTDGTSALDYFFGEPAVASLPFLLLLDLNLPDMTGMDVLMRIKSNARLRRYPVIILTTTDDRVEVQRCYDLGCSVYMTKPLVYQQFADAVRHLGQFISAIQFPEPQGTL